jgi:hypothetical protein
MSSGNARQARVDNAEEGAWMNFDRKYLIWALGYAIAGMGLGLYMAASQNHGQLVAHAHILLIGFAVSFVYAIIHRLWLAKTGKTIARVQFTLHQIATLVVSSGLMLFYGGVVSDSTIGPILGIAASGVLAGVLLMLYMVVKSQPTPA